MRFYGTLESLVSYTPLASSSYFEVPGPGATEASSSRSLEDMLSEKVQTLSVILDDVRRDIGARADLSRKVVSELTRHYCYVKTKLYELDTWPLGSNRTIENRRSRLEQQLDSLNQETRRELVSAWEAISALKKELRTWFKQYSDLVQRVALVLGTSGSREPARRIEVIPGENRSAGQEAALGRVHSGARR